MEQDLVRATVRHMLLELVRNVESKHADVPGSFSGSGANEDGQGNGTPRSEAADPEEKAAARTVAAVSDIEAHRLRSLLGRVDAKIAKTRAELESHRKKAMIARAQMLHSFETLGVGCVTGEGRTVDL